MCVLCEQPRRFPVAFPPAAPYWPHRQPHRVPIAFPTFFEDSSPDHRVFFEKCPGKSGRWLRVGAWIAPLRCSVAFPVTLPVESP